MAFKDWLSTLSLVKPWSAPHDILVDYRQTSLLLVYCTEVAFTDMATVTYP